MHTHLRNSCNGRDIQMSIFIILGPMNWSFSACSTELCGYLGACRFQANDNWKLTHADKIQSIGYIAWASLPSEIRENWLKWLAIILKISVLILWMTANGWAKKGWSVDIWHRSNIVLHIKYIHFCHDAIQRFLIYNHFFFNLCPKAQSTRISAIQLRSLTIWWNCDCIGSSLRVFEEGERARKKEIVRVHNE